MQNSEFYDAFSSIARLKAISTQHEKANLQYFKNKVKLRKSLDQTLLMFTLSYKVA